MEANVTSAPLPRSLSVAVFSAFNKNGAFHAPYGQTAQARRRSRVELWHQQERFHQAMLYPQTDGRESFVVAVTDEAAKLLDADKSRFLDNLEGRPDFDVDAIRAFFDVGPEDNLYVERGSSAPNAKRAPHRARPGAAAPPALSQPGAGRSPAQRTAAGRKPDRRLPPLTSRAGTRRSRSTSRRRRPSRPACSWSPAPTCPTSSDPTAGRPRAKSSIAPGKPPRSLATYVADTRRLPVEAHADGPTPAYATRSMQRGSSRVGLLTYVLTG